MTLFAAHPARISASWVTARGPGRCQVCGRPVEAGDQVIQVAHLVIAGQPWDSFKICLGCAPGVAAQMGTAYPGPPPPTSSRP